MLGLKEICGFAFLLGYPVVLTSPVRSNHDKRCLLKLQNRAKDLFETYKTETKLNVLHVKAYHNATARALQGIPDCSRKTHIDLSIVAAFNTLFINITDLSQKRSKDLPAEIKLLTLIGQQSVCLKNYEKPETDNLSILYAEPSNEFDRGIIYYHIFDIFKACMDQLTRTTV